MTRAGDAGGPGEGVEPRRSRPRVPKGARPVSLAQADQERLLSMILALAAEVSALTEEVDDLRGALLAQRALTVAELELYRPDAPGRERREARRRDLLQRMLRIVLEDLDGEAGARRGERYREFVESLSR